MADFGLYNALRAKPDYDQRRKDAQAAMSIMATLGKAKRDDLEARNKALSDIGAKFDEIAAKQKDLLDQDAERVVEAEKGLRSGIVEELGKWDNNPDLFMLMGGEAMMNKYVKDVMGLDAMKKGIQNKANVLQAAKDQAEGKTWRGVQLGDQIVPFNEQIAAFENGDIDEIQYNGAFESPKVDPLEFTKTVNPNNPYKSEPVDLGLFANYLQLRHGMNPDDAIWWMKQNKEEILDPSNPNNTRFMWGSREKPKPDYSGERLAWDKWKYNHPQATEDKQVQWIADNAYDVVTNPERWSIHFKDPKNPGMGRKYVATDAFRGVQMKGTNTDAAGVMKEVNRKLYYMMRFPNDDNIYPLFEDQVHNGSFLATDAKKNAPIRLDDFNNSFLIPAITATYGTNADVKLEQIRDYAVKQGIAKDLNIPYIEGAPASTTPTGATEDDDYDFNAPPQ